MKYCLKIDLGVMDSELDTWKDMISLIIPSGLKKKKKRLTFTQ